MLIFIRISQNRQLRPKICPILPSILYLRCLLLSVRIGLWTLTPLLPPPLVEFRGFWTPSPFRFTWFMDAACKFFSRDLLDKLVLKMKKVWLNTKLKKNGFWNKEKKPFLKGRKGLREVADLSLRLFYLNHFLKWDCCWC